MKFGGSLVRNACVSDLKCEFLDSLAQNARFGDLTSKFWKKSREMLETFSPERA